MEQSIGQSLVLYDEKNNEVSLKIDEIKKYIAPNATESEFWLFINTARMLNLNPIKKEIYFIKYGEKAQIVVGYQTYLMRALESKLVEYWNVEVEKPDVKDRSTWVGVFTGKRTDWTKEFEWRVPMVEVDKKQSTWNLMPEFLLKKNTLAQGIRMLIPEILSQLPYSVEEVTAGTSEMMLEIPEAKLIEPSAEESQAKSQATREALNAIADNIAKCDTLEKVNKLYSQSKLDKSELKVDIEALLNERRYQLKIVKLSELTGIIHADILEYVNEDILNSVVVIDALAGNKEAIKEFATSVNSFLQMKSESVDEEEATDRDSELDLEAEPGEDLI